MNKNIINSELKYYGQQPEFEDNFESEAKKADSPAIEIASDSYIQFKKRRDAIIGAIALDNLSLQ
ncbi:MAG: hypothetical protein WCP03_04245 [Candidatus Saccharibacteria bacterium]